MAVSESDERPTIAMALGDPSGISPELHARILCDAELRRAARLVSFGDARLLAMGAADGGVEPDVRVVADGAALPDDPRPILVDLANLDPATLERGKVTLAGGRAAIANFRRALEFAAGGRADAVFYTPFNKSAMRMAHPDFEDDLGFMREVLAFAGPASELNVLDRLWNCRVTSHIPLARVAESITGERILQSLLLADASLRAAGFAPPRIAVAAINPHAGDNGNYGREEIDVIEPAVGQAKALGLTVDGPFPSDTVFVRARSGQFDAVLTMYHDQGQIAMKLMGFDRGVTLMGGLPFPVCTPAHGTAYDIAGKGTANLGATRAALALAVRMAAERRAARPKAA